MLIKGTPCPECDGFFFLVPYCEKCGWKDEGWFKEQEKIASEMMRLFLEQMERYHKGYHSSVTSPKPGRGGPE